MIGKRHGLARSLHPRRHAHVSTVYRARRYSSGMKRRIIAVVMATLGSGAWAAGPQIVNASVEKTGMVWSVSVTLKHPDTGWDHYADGWEVLDAQGNRLGYRELLHPHVQEQPFTRSLNGLVLPDGTREIFIRAHCSADGWKGDPVRVELSP